MTKTKSNHEGSFVTGFTLGIAVSAVGYFFFGTKRGKKLKNTLSKKWQEAGIEIPDQKNNLQPGTLREAVRYLISHISTAVEQEVKKPAKKTKTRKKKKTVFQGIK